MRKRVFSFLWILFPMLTGTEYVHAMPVPQASDAVHVQARLDTDQYLIGDFLHLHIAADFPRGVTMQWPAPQSVSDFDLISSGPVDTLVNGSMTQYSQELIFSVYDSGRYAVPEIAFYYSRPGIDSSYVLFSDSIPFTVHTLAVDTTAAIKPIKGPMEVQVKNYTWLYIAGGILLLALLILGIYYAFFARKSKRQVSPFRKKTLYQHTMDLLAALDAKKLWQKDAVKEYYVELTEILRSYMEHRYRIQALESTSDEILQQLVMKGVPQDQTGAIDTILRNADLAKFAKSRPSGQDNTEAMQLAVEFVEMTKPVETAEEEKRS